MIATQSRHPNGLLPWSRQLKHRTSRGVEGRARRWSRANHRRRFGLRRIESAAGLGLATEFSKFFSPGSNPGKSPRELVSAVAQAVRARADSAEKIRDGVEKSLCDTAFLHSM
jgi:hypothetical protein